jgi:hypothetical protein
VGRGTGTAATGNNLKLAGTLVRLTEGEEGWEMKRGWGLIRGRGGGQAAKRALQAHFFQELQKGPVVDADGQVAYLEVADTPPVA